MFVKRALFCLLFFSALIPQTFTQSCEACQSIEEDYREDAVQLAARIMSGHPDYQDIIEIPEELIDRMLSYLIAIYNATDIPERDQVIDCYNIHTFPEVVTQSFIMGVDDSYPWAQELLDENIPTGNTEIDDLFAEYEISVESTISSIGAVVLASEKHLNLGALFTNLQDVEGINYVEQNGVFGDGSNIMYQDFGSYAQLTYNLGWGDCPAGCIFDHFWVFNVLDDCSVEFVQEYGEGPIPVECGNYVPFSDASIQIGFGNGEDGSTVLVPVWAENVTAIRGLNLSLTTADADMAEIVGVANVAVAGMSADDFEVSNNQLTLNWSSDELTSVTDGEPLFYVVVALSGDRGDCTDILFMETPTLFNSDEEAQRMCTVAGQACTSNVLFGIPENCAEQGSIIDLPVYVKYFQDMVSFQFSFNWDPNVLEFHELTNFDLPDLDANNFGVFPEDGVLTALWYDNSVNGVTLADSSILFRIQFTVVDNGCEENPEDGLITFTGNPVPQEIIQLNNEIFDIVDPLYIPGAVEVLCPFQLEGVSTIDPSCFNTCDGAISLQISGGKEPYTVAWEQDLDGAAIENLCLDTYQATITDGLGTQIVTEPITFSQLPVLMLDIQTVDATPGQTGSATVAVSGGTPPYQYDWSADPADLPPGEYSVTVTDANGCIVTETFLIELADGVLEPESLVQFDVFPNPASEVLQVDYLFRTSISVQVDIYNIHGQLMWTRKQLAGEESFQVSIGRWSPGTYILKLKSVYGNSVRRFQKQ